MAYDCNAAYGGSSKKQRVFSPQAHKHSAALQCQAELGLEGRQCRRCCGTGLDPCVDSHWPDLYSPAWVHCQMYAAEIETLRGQLVSEGRRAGVLGAQVSALQGQAGLSGDSVAMLAATQVSPDGGMGFTVLHVGHCETGGTCFTLALCARRATGTRQWARLR